MIDIEESYYTVTKVIESQDCDHGACKLYFFEHDGGVFQVGIYEGDEVISIFETVDVEQYNKSREVNDA